MKSIVFRLLGVLIFAMLSNSPMPSKADDTLRMLVVISDLHIGIGRNASGKWEPVEDFRWSKALQGFLEHISSKGNDRVDLVIAGDFLELWQTPADIACLRKGPDLGCSISEVKQIVAQVIDAHHDEFAAIAAFARKGSNHVHVIPGNHDAAIVIPEVWGLLAAELEAENGRISLVKDGIWSSSDGKVLIEHGHQIGNDANRFSDWPKITTPGSDGRVYLIQPWGELFVQRLFNKEEKTYPIIDNLSPETAGLKYRMCDRGVWGSAIDIANFVAFNIFQTSLMQKSAALGQTGSGKNPPPPCTRKLGYRLFADALPWNDPLRSQIEANNEESKELRAKLDELAQRLPEEDIAHLCALRSKTTLGAFLEKTFIPRKEVLRKHLGTRLRHYPDTTFFIYGHTHQLEEPWPVTIEKLHRRVTVLNAGAFQRLIDESGYKARVDLERSCGGLSNISLENLAPCYSSVFLEYKQGMPLAEVRLWYMPEESIGHEVSPGSSKCQ